MSASTHNLAEAGRAAAIARLTSLAAKALRSGNPARAAELDRRILVLRGTDGQEAVQQELHADTVQGPDADPEMVDGWTACDALVDAGRCSMTAFWTATKRGAIRSCEWGGVVYVHRADAKRVFPAKASGKAVA